MSLSQDSLSRFIALCAWACGGILAAIMALTALSGDGASILFSGGVMLILFLLGAVALARRPLFSRPGYALGAVGLLFLALCLRLSLFDHISGDYVSFLSVWTETMRGMTVSEALSTPIGDYNMPYLYLILLISRMPFYDLYCIKLCSVAADVAAALAVGRLSARVARRDGIVLLAFAAALLAPTTWLNSAYWGQCDSIYGALGLWGLYWGLEKKPVRSLVFFALSLAFKLQAVFLLPILALLLVREYISLRQLPAFPLAFLASMVPALLGGRSLGDTFSIYWSQTQAYPYLSLSAPTFWSLIDNSYFYELSSAPVLLGLAGALTLLALALERRDRLGRRELLTLALMFSLMIPWLLPKMHERYFYLAEILSIVYWAAYPKRIGVPAVILTGGFFAYSAYLFGGVPVGSMGLVALFYGGTLGYLLLRFFEKPQIPGKN